MFTSLYQIYNQKVMFGASVARIENSYPFDITTQLNAENERQKSDVGTLQNGQITNFYFKKLKEQELALSFLVIINIYLVVFQTDLAFPEVADKELSTLHICQYFTIVCVLITIVLILMRSYTLLQLQIAQKILYEKSTLISTKKILYLAVEWVVLLLQPYPFLIDIKFQTANSYDDYPINYPVNDILAIASFSRIYILVRAALILTPYMTNRLCKMYGCRADYSYSLKCLFKDHPLTLIAAVYFIMAAIFAYIVYLAQRQLLIQNGNNPQKPLANAATNFANAVWLIFITTTTVGYGDFYPQTPLGRIIVLFVAIWGTLIVSIMVVVVSNTLRMEKSQLRTSKLLNKLYLKQQLEIKSSKVVGYFLLSKLTKDRENKQRAQKKLHHARKQLIALRKMIKQATEINDLQDEIATHFLKLNNDIQILNKNQDNIIQFIHDNFDAKPKQTEQVLQSSSDSQEAKQQPTEENIQPKFMEMFKHQLKMKMA